MPRNDTYTTRSRTAKEAELSESKPSAATKRLTQMAKSLYYTLSKNSLIISLISSINLLLAL